MNPSHKLNDGNTFGFGGQDHDPVSGLVYLRARYYAPGLGRFTAPDPLVMAGFELPGMSPYAYGRDNPLSYLDPSGLVAEKLKSSGKDAVLFVLGAIAQYSDIMTFSVGSQAGLEEVMADMGGPFNAGRALGASLGLAVGVVEMINGAIEAASGGGLTISGNVLALGLTTAGVAEAGIGLAHSQAALSYFAKYSSGGNDPERPLKKDSSDLRQLKDAARKAGLTNEEIREFRRYVEAQKRSFGRGGADNLSFGELVEMAGDWKNGVR
ncbi:MAG: RHS repeat-associated core domain-containing protein [Bacillota bacterium]